MGMDVIDQALEILRLQRVEKQKLEEQESQKRTVIAHERKCQLDELEEFLRTIEPCDYEEILHETGKRVVITMRYHPNNNLLAVGGIIWGEQDGNNLAFYDVHGLGVNLNLSGLTVSVPSLGKVLDEWVERHNTLPIPNILEHIRREMRKIAQELVDEDKKRQRSSEDV